MTSAPAPATVARDGGRNGPGLVPVLAVTQTVGYGVLYYAFAVLIAPMAVELHTDTVHLSAALTISVLVAAGAAVPVGRWLDRHGGRAARYRGRRRLGSRGALPRGAERHRLARSDPRARRPQ